MFGLASLRNSVRSVTLLRSTGFTLTQAKHVRYLQQSTQKTSEQGWNRNLLTQWPYNLIAGATMIGAGYYFIARKPTLMTPSSSEKAPEQIPEATSTLDAPLPVSALEGESNEKSVTPAEPATEPQSKDEAARILLAKTQKLEPFYFNYVLVGSGTASLSAALSIRRKDPEAQILIIGEENHLPYNRTPLSKELWHANDSNIGQTLAYKAWDGQQKSLFYESGEQYLDVYSTEAKEEMKKYKERQKLKESGHKSEEPFENHIKFAKNKKAVALNVDSQMVALDNGQKVYYQKLLLASGGSPKELPITKTLPEEAKIHITTFRRVDDFRYLEQLTAKGEKHIAIVGGGFLGSELACALAHRAKSVPNLKITQIFPEEGNMSAIFPKYLSQWVAGKLRQDGINVLPQTQIASIQSHSNGLTLNLAPSKSTNPVASNSVTTQSIDVDHVIVCIGIDANVDLARGAGLEIDEKRGGIVVNAELEARSNVYAAGDVISYHDIALKRRRVEHYDHAVVSGKVAGENMTGERKPYKHQSMFWSDLGPTIGYEAVGLIDSSLVTVGVWAKAGPGTKDSPKEAAAQGNIRSADMKDITDSSLVPKPTPEVNQPTEAFKADSEKYGKGVIYYLRDKKVVGILTFNLFNKTDLARQIIRDGKAYNDLSELAKLIRLETKKAEETPQQ